jgi:hypothetical protein
MSNSNIVPESLVDSNNLCYFYLSQLVAIKVLPSLSMDLVDAYSLEGLVEGSLSKLFDEDGTMIGITGRKFATTRNFLPTTTFVDRIGDLAKDCNLCKTIFHALGFKGHQAISDKNTESLLRQFQNKINLAFSASLGEPTGYIYLVELDGCLKLGYSTNPNQRIKGYGITSYKTDAIKIMEGNSRSELYLHRFLYSDSEKYDKSRKSEIVEAMERVQTAHALRFSSLIPSNTKK